MILKITLAVMLIYGFYRIIHAIKNAPVIEEPEENINQYIFEHEYKNCFQRKNLSIGGFNKNANKNTYRRGRKHILRNDEARYRRAKLSATRRNLQAKREIKEY